MKYSLPKGTFDILPEQPHSQDQWKESGKWLHLETIIRALATQYGYEEIRTPLFEEAALFTRGVGETSDIVSKEMYTFQDKGKRSMSLRPEGTASVMRAFVQGQLQQLGSFHKFFYIGPFFRYDRPQAGRYRQFHQFGVEAIGNGGAEQDFEVIELLYEFYRRLKLKNLHVMVNTLGDHLSREKYKTSLLAYLKPHFQSLSEESKARFTNNPLRILDSKNPKEQELLKTAPSILDFLNSDSQKHFEALCTLLKKQNIPFTISPHLVRGLDYYNHTVFEVTSDVLGAQNTLGAGGRYDGLLPAVGGPDLPCVGFSTGLERILHTMVGQEVSFPEKKGPLVTLISLDEKAKGKAFELLYTLRHAHISAEMISGKKVQKALKQADQQKTEYVIILGEKELESNTAYVKDMSSRQEVEVSLSELTPYLSKKNHEL